MKNKLDEIIAYKRIEVERRKIEFPFEQLIERAWQADPTEDFSAALLAENPDEIVCIAEIKKASPSKGILTKDFSPERIAREYKQGGAKALSVLTDEKYFQGHDDYILAAKNAGHLPVLRKDFIVDEYQIYESRMIGADAILLIVAANSDEQIHSYLATANDLVLSVLVECHSKEEIDRALDAGATIIGINNRNLQTFEVDINTSLNLKHFIPNNRIAVSESGISNYNTVERLAQAGFNAVLVGEHLMIQSDKTNAVKELLGKKIPA